MLPKTRIYVKHLGHRQKYYEFHPHINKNGFSDDSLIRFCILKRDRLNATTHNNRAIQNVINFYFNI